jgi:hypothetical protein
MSSTKVESISDQERRCQGAIVTSIGRNAQLRAVVRRKTDDDIGTVDQNECYWPLARPGTSMPGMIGPVEA